VVWLTIVLLLLAVAVVLGLTLLVLWRQVKGLARTVADAGESVGTLTIALQDAQAGGPLAPKPHCAACGASASAARPELVAA
jgi:hypothetical protein